MKDIAAQAGVSPTAVSFVLNKRQRSNGSISEKTRLRVLDAAAKLNYQPNELARAVKSGRSRVIGFLTSKPQAEHVARLIKGVLDEADERDFLVKIMCPREVGFDQRLVDQCIQFQLAGIVTAFIAPDVVMRYHDELAPRGIPVALLDDCAEYAWGAPVLADYEGGMNQAVAHLVELGHQKIGFVGAPLGHPNTNLRLPAFAAALAAHSLPFEPRWMVHEKLEVNELLQTMRASYSDPKNRPTAVITATDMTALTLLRMARTMRWEVPRKLSVVGFGDLQMSALCDPPLTVIKHPFHEMGRSAARLLLNRLEAAKNGEKNLEPIRGGRIATDLIVRETTAPPATQ